MKIKKLLAALMAITLIGGAVTATPKYAAEYSMTASADVKKEFIKTIFDEKFTYGKYPDHVVVLEFNKAIEGDVVIPNEIEGLPVTCIEKEVFAWCEGMTSLTIPDSVTNIGTCAFYGCKKIRSITIPDNVTSIEAGTFYSCESLESIKIPEGVTSIETGAFSECTMLSSITIPDSVKSIGFGAFSGCRNIKDVVILDPYCEIYDDAATICTAYDIKEYDPLTFINIEFDGTIYGYNNSTAQAYAEKYGYKFESLGEAPEEPEYKLGDPTGDGIIDAVDASYILALYAKSSTSDEAPTEYEWLTCDVNKNGLIDAVDASTVLAYYAHVSTDGKLSLEEFMAKV